MHECLCSARWQREHLTCKSFVTIICFSRCVACSDIWQNQCTMHALTFSRLILPFHFLHVVRLVSIYAFRKDDQCCSISLVLSALTPPVTFAIFYLCEGKGRLFSVVSACLYYSKIMNGFPLGLNVSRERGIALVE